MIYVDDNQKVEKGICAGGPTGIRFPSIIAGSILALDSPTGSGNLDRTGSLRDRNVAVALATDIAW